MGCFIISRDYNRASKERDKHCSSTPRHHRVFERQDSADSRDTMPYGQSMKPSVEPLVTHSIGATQSADVLNMCAIPLPEDVGTAEAKNNDLSSKKRGKLLRICR